MNKTKVILFVIVIIVLCAGVLYGIRFGVQNSSIKNIEQEENIELTGTTTVYKTEQGNLADVTYYDNDTAILTIENSEYKDVKFNLVMSASGVRYENLKQDLVLWEKAPELSVYKNNALIFFGSSMPDVTDITKYTWTWDSIIIGNPNSPDEIINTSKPGVFTVKFYKDQTISGTTDCNNFSGTYYLDENRQINIGPLMSTLMYCEGSQEQDFFESIKDGKITYGGDSFQLYGSSSKVVYFIKKQEESVQ